MDEATGRHGKGMTDEESADDLLSTLDLATMRRNPQGLYSAMQIIFNELDGRLSYHLRKNYPKHLANAYRLGQEFPRRHPNLAREAHAVPAR